MVFLTIGVEAFSIMAIMKYSWKKSLVAAVVGNLVSGLIGSFVMMWAMLFWHTLVDNLLSNATFDIVNWMATYVIMCLGSVALEIMAIQIIFKESLRKLFVPFLVGNLLTYSFIAYNIYVKSVQEESSQVKKEKVFYSPTPNTFDLLDDTKLLIYTARAETEYDKDGIILTKEIPLEIPYEEEFPEYFNFELRLVGDKYAGGIENGRKLIRLKNLSDTINIVLEQKNPNPNVGWKEPICTDTINFIKRADYVLIQLS